MSENETMWREALEMKVKGLEEELEKSRELVKTVREEKEQLKREHEVQKEKLANGYIQRLAESDQRWAERHAVTILRQGQLVERLDKLIEAALPRLGVEPPPRGHQAGCKSCGHDFCEC